MSAEELSKLLDEYGIKHGPVVDSTRRLYEWKLNEAMSKLKRVKPLSHKTSYREEEEKVTYVYRSPVRARETNRIHSSAYIRAYMRSRPRWASHKEERRVRRASSPSTMSDGQISKLLDEYGIKHGPVIDSTRRLYERKLNEAMSEGTPGKPTSDQTEEEEEEEEETTFIYRTPVKGEEAGDSYAYMRSRPHQPERQFEQGLSYSSYSRTAPEYRRNDFANQFYKYKTPSTYKNINYKSASVKSAQETQKQHKPFRLIPRWMQIVFLVAVAGFFCVVFASMETNKLFPGLQ